MVFEGITKGIASSLSELGNRFVEYFPSVVGAIIILIIGYIIGVIAGLAVRKFLERIKADDWLVKKTKISKTFGDFKVSYLFATLTKWWIVVLFLPAAAEIVALETFANLLVSLALWIPNLIAAILVALIGFTMASYTEAQIVSTKIKSAKSVGNATSILIIVFTVLIALRQLNIGVNLAETSFLIILSGIVFAVALALGIGFGYGLRDEAKKIVKDFLKSNK